MEIQPETGSLSPAAANQYDLAKKPQRFRFQIFYLGNDSAGVANALGRAMIRPNERVVDQVDLNINPSQYRVQEPTRQGVTQTVSGAWVDFYGLGLPKITMSGTTGYRPNPAASKKPDSMLGGLLQAGSNVVSAALGQNPVLPNPPTGLRDFVYLRNRIFRSYAVLLQNMKLNFSKRVQEKIQLRFYAWDTEDYYIVLIDSFDLQRSAARPLMYDYNIQMTVIGYVGQSFEVTDYLNAYWKPEARLSSIRDTLNRWVANAQNFQNAVTSLNQTLSDDINTFTNGISLLTQAVDSVVSGAESLITMPFTAVQLVAAQGRALGDFIGHLESIPVQLRNDIHNSLLETICACYGLTTYQSLFTKPFGDVFSDAPWKNLTCSSSLGIPPNPTTPDSGVSTPALDVSAANAGAYDPNTLQTVPSSLGNFSTRATAPYRLREVDIVEGQTVESLIASIGGLDADVAQVWQQIVTLNGLEYPYIAPNAGFQTDFKAVTTITIYGTPGTAIPSGTRVGTQQITTKDDIIIFVTQNSATIGSNGSVSVSVKALQAGDFANINAFSLVQFIDITGSPTAIAGVTRIENSTAATGGKILKVLSPGKKIQIPVPQSQTKVETTVDRTGINEESLFGNDIYLTDGGDFLADGQGDLAIVNGIENMKVALLDRLTTEQGELTKHPTYGIPLSHMLGEPGDQHGVTVAKLEIQATLLQDPRIKSVENMTVKKSQDQLSVDMNLHLIDETTRATGAELPVGGA